MRLIEDEELLLRPMRHKLSVCICTSIYPCNIWCLARQEHWMYTNAMHSCFLLFFPNELCLCGIIRCFFLPALTIIIYLICAWFYCRGWFCKDGWQHEFYLQAAQLILADVWWCGGNCNNVVVKDEKNVLLIWQNLLISMAV